MMRRLIAHRAEWAAASMEPFVYVIIVNWNGWPDTIECLESVLRSEHRAFAVIVCDNGSADGSVGRLAAWAEGRLEPPAATSAALAPLTRPPVHKPVPYVAHHGASAGTLVHAGERPRLEFICTGRNLGFAGANNVALRLVLARGDFDYVWLLNNDTVARPDALQGLVARMQQAPGAGMCGCTLLFYGQPETVQALGGGACDSRTAVCRHVGSLAPAGSLPGRDQVERDLDYVAGASMLVSNAFLRDVGVMDERYFLYYEELDWSARARGRYGLAWAPDSVVYHKAGASTGLSELRRGEAAEYYMRRSQLLYARKHLPRALPRIHLANALGLFTALVRLRFARVATLARVYRRWLEDR